ncbi:hypothetical protein K440DRAFT_643919 [Wilcoxina mikolae CBS 423.85]|nr:hypothetical protein K440DRAFT_643919 [Wilcoxina mikolae CBS 423.85]
MSSEVRNQIHDEGAVIASACLSLTPLTPIFVSPRFFLIVILVTFALVSSAMVIKVAVKIVIQSLKHPALIPTAAEIPTIHVNRAGNAAEPSLRRSLRGDLPGRRS